VPLHLQWQTLLHEILHIVELAFCFELKDKSDDSDVDRIATGVLDILIANGWLDLE
jgi:hypothetical protein